MTDRELLELAAKAAGYEIVTAGQDVWLAKDGMSVRHWNPLTDGEDALRLMVRLKIEVDHNHSGDQQLYVVAARRGCEMAFAPVAEVESFEDECNRLAATRRAIVRAAAEIGRATSSP